MADKMEMKTYALGIGTWECYDAIFNKEKKDALKALCSVQGLWASIQPIGCRYCYI